MLVANNVFDETDDRPFVEYLQDNFYARNGWFDTPDETSYPTEYDAVLIKSNGLLPRTLARKLRNDDNVGLATTYVDGSLARRDYADAGIVMGLVDQRE